MAVDLVGADLDVAAVLVASRRLEEDERADDIGLQEGPRFGDAAVDVRFRREVDDRVGAGGEVVDDDRVGDVAAHERVARVRRHLSQVGEVARVGELVEHDHLGRIESREQPADERGPDEPGAAGHQEPHGRTVAGSTVSASTSAMRPLASTGRSAANVAANALASWSASIVPASIQSPVKSCAMRLPRAT